MLNFDPLSIPLVLPAVAEATPNLDLARKTRCVIYARYSNTGDSPDSIERQIKKARPYAEAAGMTVVKIYEEPRKSGTTVSKRMVLREMLAELDELNVGHVIVESQDRLGRKMVILAELWERIHERGVPIHSARAGAPIDIVRWCVEAGFIEEERNRTVERLRSGIDKSAREGKPMMGRCFGYTHEVRGSVAVRVIHTKEAEIIRFIFRKFNEGWHPARIAAHLNAAEEGGACGRRWTAAWIRGAPSMMTGILRRYRYTGYQSHRVTRTVEVEGKRRNVLRPSNEWTISAHVPELQIISAEEFNAAQSRLTETSRKNGKTRPKSAHGKRLVRPLQGLVRCAQCGGGMSAKTDPNGFRHDRYMCNVARNRSSPGAKYCVMGGGVVRYRLEDAFAELLGDELVHLDRTAAFVRAFNANLSSGPKDAEGERRKLERQLADISRKVEKTWDDAYNLGMTPEWIADIRKKLQAEEERLRERLVALSVPAAEPLQLAPEKNEALLNALSGLMTLDRVDTSTDKGAELIASLHEQVDAVFLGVSEDGSFTMRIAIRPEPLLRAGSRIEGAAAVILERRFPKAVRGYFGSRRFARQIAAKVSERRHCLSDGQWDAIRDLVPPRVGASNRRGSGAILDLRTVVEAALFHLQTGAPLRALPDCFGPPQEVFNALRRLQQSGAWNALEPVLRGMAPDLFERVKASRTFPLCNPEIPAARDLRRMTVDARAAAGLHRLSDREWAIAAPLVAGKVTEFGSAAARLDPRRVLDGMMFMLKENVPYSRMPLHFGPRDKFQQVVRRLVAHHCWDRIVEAFRQRSPSSLVGLDQGRLVNHARSQNDNPAFRVKHERHEIVAKLRRIRDLHDRGTPYKEAARMVGVSETQLHRWRRDPRYRV